MLEKSATIAFAPDAPMTKVPAPGWRRISPSRSSPVERAAHGDPRDAVLARQLRLAGQAGARGEGAADDAIAQQQVDAARLRGLDTRLRLLVVRFGASLHPVPPLRPVGMRAPSTTEHFALCIRQLPGESIRQEPPVKGKSRRTRPPCRSRRTGPGPSSRRPWDEHVVTTRDDGSTLLFIDRHFVHEGSFHAFDKLAAKGLPVSRPDLTFGVADHYVPTRGRGQGIADAEVRRMVDQLAGNARAQRDRALSASTIRARVSSMGSSARSRGSHCRA